MTLEKKSKISLKQWVTTIRRYEYELPRLYEKLEYLKVRSIGYSSPSFDPKFGARGSSNNYSIDYWLEKIDACEAQIKKRNIHIKNYYEFRKLLSIREQYITDEYLYKDNDINSIMACMQISRSVFYTTFKKMSNKYLKFKSYCP